MRTCPVCTFPLSLATTNGVVVHHCRRCTGTFVDLKASTAAFGGLGNPGTWEAEHIPRGPEARRLCCPADGQVMNAWHVQSAQAGVVVDVCPDCAGLWLDAQEGDKLARIMREKGYVATPPTAQPEPTEEPPTKPTISTYLFQLFTGLPLEVWHPVKRRPWMVYALLLTLIGVFLWEFGGGAPEAVIAAFGLHQQDVFRGLQPWTLLTSGFLHGSLIHLLGNLYFLWVFGDNVEDHLGSFGFLKIYFVALVVGGLAQVVMMADPTLPVVGASGAIAGLMGAYMALFPRVRVYVVWLFIRFKVPVFIYLGLWVLLQVVAAATGAPGVAWFAHLGGFAAGFAMGTMARKPDTALAV